ncbi:hypothetical protein [Xanthomonas tesorieronis]|uniref:hypothetical protein n=1 Tax=Xanthomonas tesorieronis TaxID=3160839 RepID=UPI0035114B08
MSVSASTRCLRLALALALALQSASGWAVLPATFAYWVLVVLLAAVIDHLAARGRSGALPLPATATTTQDDVDLADVAQARLPPPAQPALPASAAPARPPGARQWRRHLDDVVPYPEERFPRQGICTTLEQVLRAGDALVLAFHPADGGPAQWCCDLLAPGATRAQWLDVAADAECVVPIAQTGVYSIGIGQAELRVPGTVSLWLRVPDPERLALPLQPLRGTSLAYVRRGDGAIGVEDVAGQGDWPLAQLPTRSAARVPAGAALLFASVDRHWDVAGVPDPAAADSVERAVVVYRHFLQLSRGDVLVLEAAWTSSLFGRPVPMSGGTSPSGGELRLFALLQGPQLAALWPCAGAQACVEVVCPADGLYCLELRLAGPPAWRGRAAEAFADLRLWGTFVQRAPLLRAFSLQQVWVDDRYQQCLPVPLP